MSDKVKVKIYGSIPLDSHPKMDEFLKNFPRSHQPFVGVQFDPTFKKREVTFPVRPRDIYGENIYALSYSFDNSRGLLATMEAISIVSAAAEELIENTNGPEFISSLVHVYTEPAPLFEKAPTDTAFILLKGFEGEVPKNEH